ncbi:carbohydrate ABC transporter permease [Pararhizobium sp. PWRC1-1]|uniref:carbohydrate ABC transporter permease n=1 Tax=Pararhizobium sp. PWRC1-1 TaxID=2804566 RepID=UPI003CEA68E0
MPHKAFFAFIMPSLVAMLLFIALPIFSVAVQSLYVQHERVVTVVETCTPFAGCTKEARVDAEATEKLRNDEPLGRFNGFGTYVDRNHLAVAEIGAIVSDNAGFKDALSRIYNLPFYRALAFTLTYTFVVTPLAMLLGFCIALGVNAIPPFYKGPVIFFSLLPMIVTPLVGAMIMYWMASSQGILGATLQNIFNDPTLSLKSSAMLTWITLLAYGIWHNAPFSFVVFYAGLQTVPHDTIESAMIDGASRWERVRFVIIPHLMPLATFVALVQLMDNFRVFEPIVGFSAEANASSLSWSIFNDLRGQVDQLFGSAAATSMLTIVGVIILLSPVLVRTWREFNRR